MYIYVYMLCMIGIDMLYIIRYVVCAQVVIIYNICGCVKKVMYVKYVMYI
jgi:hypothetical protein